MKIRKGLTAVLAATGLTWALLGWALAAPPVSAASMVLVNGKTGDILCARNCHEERLIASTTKLMTAYTAVHCGANLEKTIAVSSNAAGVEGSSMYLAVGEEISLEELLWGMLLVSGNDAATALAEGCCGSVEDFVAEMNRQAGELGMAQSHFENPTGLDGDYHYSTAADLAILAQAVLEEPQLMEIVSSKSAQVHGQTLYNHNKLLSYYPDCTGMKTGYTQQAGRTLVSSARRGGVSLICVTLNDPNDWADHQTLFEYGFQLLGA